VNLKEEDLITKCRRCDGTGYFKEITGSRSAVGVSITREGSCPDCSGGGGTLTEAGQAVAQVVSLMRKSGQI